MSLAWESAPPTSLREGGVTAKGRDGGRDGRTEPRLYARLPRAYVLNVSGGCGHPPLHTGFRRPFRRGRCPHRPAAPAGAEPPTSLREGGVTAKGRDGGRDGRTESSAPTIVYRTCALLLPCHSEPVTDVTGVGIRIPRPLPLPLGEVAERSEDGEGKQRRTAFRRFFQLVDKPSLCGQRFFFTIQTLYSFVTMGMIMGLRRVVL